jgi:hypothetical protein
MAWVTASTTALRLFAFFASSFCALSLALRFEFWAEL